MIATDKGSYVHLVNPAQSAAVIDSASMVHKPYWWFDLGSIEHRLNAITEPLLDRHAMEYVFRVSQTEAGRLMRRIGCVYVGKSKAVIRHQVAEWIRQVRRSEGYEMEMRRVARIEAHLEEASKHLAGRRVEIKITGPLPDCVEELPKNIALDPGRLVIEYRNAEQLLEALYAISEAASRDWRGFQEVCEVKENGGELRNRTPIP